MKRAISASWRIGSFHLATKKRNNKQMKNALLLMSVILFCWSCNQQKTVKIAEQKSSINYQLIAHRGGIIEGRFNEFDPKSLQAAIDSGYWMLEVDLRPTMDKHVILQHDASLKRIYGVDNSPELMTLSELKKLKAIGNDYAPMTLEEASQLCQGKVRFMIDLKPQLSAPWFYARVDSILTKYNMLHDALFIRNDIQSSFSDGKFGFRMAELAEFLKRMKNGEPITQKYYLFDHGNRLNAETVRICQKNNIEVCASVNIGHYALEPHEPGARRDIEYLKKCGVTLYQIDSEYDSYFEK
jgi:glycerophosphoryl diester phosphodiesterase